MHVRVTRRGGLTGIPLTGELETATLPPEAARLAETALSHLPRSSPSAPPSHPEAFQYDIATSDGHALTIDESELTDDLRPLIDVALTHGHLS